MFKSESRLGLRIESFKFMLLCLDSGINIGKRYVVLQYLLSVDGTAVLAHEALLPCLTVLLWWARCSWQVRQLTRTARQHQLFDHNTSVAIFNAGQ